MPWGWGGETVGCFFSLLPTMRRLGGFCFLFAPFLCPMNSCIAPTIFKAYDIRGTVPVTIDAQVALWLGRAFGTRARALGEKTVAVGRDGRLSGPQLSAALIEGLVQAGVEVIDLGMCTTPMLYFAAHTVCRSGIQVTGSHNPKDDNGFKMMLAGRTIYGQDITELGQMMRSQDWQPCAGGSVRTHDVWPAYRDRIVGDVRLSRPMKVVVDCGNGVAGATAPALLQALGCEVEPLFTEVDGHFPNHHPDPSKPANLRDVQQALQNGGAEIGLAFDGDGDRLGVVTKDGTMIFPDRQIVLFARDILSRCPGGTVVFDVKCSQQLAPAIEAAGGVPLMHATGHSLIKAQMKQTQAVFGGEMSGHLFFAERWFGFDDATYAAARLLEILSAAPDANAMLHALPTGFSTPEINIAAPQDQSAHALAAQLQTLAPAHFDAPAHISTIDGLRVDFPDGFGLIRASNTTPVLVLRFEGQTPQALERIRAQMLHLLRQVLPDAQLPDSSNACQH